MKSAVRAFLKVSGDVIFRFRNALFPVVGVLMALTSRPASFPGSARKGLALAFAGVAVALAGQAIRLMTIGYDYIKRGGLGGKVYADNLVTGGFYAVCRNPMYVGNTLIVIGFAMAYGSKAAYFVAVPFFLYAYAAIIIAEETYLAGKFGAQYEAYKRDVPRVFPKADRLARALEGSRYDWKKALRKDYGQVFQTLFILVLIGMGRIRLGGGDFSGKKAAFLTAAAAVSILFFVVSRILKKTNRLASEAKKA
jgi:protein-S-isoprenylcysteine O-methyltransferase Ste14